MPSLGMELQIVPRSTEIKWRIFEHCLRRALVSAYKVFDIISRCVSLHKPWKKLTNVTIGQEQPQITGSSCEGRQPLTTFLATRRLGRQEDDCEFVEQHSK